MDNNYISNIHFSEIEVLRQSWKCGSAYSYIMKKRPYFGICYVISGKIEYTTSGKALTAFAGDVVIIRAGSHYRAVFSSESAKDILINFRTSGDFHIDIPDDIGIIKNRSDLQESFSEIASYALSGDRGCMVKSLFYGIWDALSDSAAEKGLADKIRRTLLRDSTFSVTEKEISEICAVSVSTVQRAFKKRFGKSIAEYKNEIRTARAKRLLLSGRYSVEETAEKLGFCDCAHFSRSFKKATGLSPKKYIASPQSPPFF